MIGERVMKAAAEVHRDPALPPQGQPPGERRSPRADPRRFAQRRRKGDLQHELVFVGQRARLDLVQVVGRVDQGDVLVGSRRGLDEIEV